MTDLNAEIRDLTARRDITEAVHRYMRGLDRLDAPMQRSAFHDDAIVDAGIIKGAPDDFVARSQELLAGMRATHHLLGQVHLRLDGDRAEGECYFQAWHDMVGEDGKPRDLFIAGRYIDKYRQIAGDWRIWRRRLITDWVTDTPASRAFVQANPENHRGGRRGEDFSDNRNWEN